MIKTMISAIAALTCVVSANETKPNIIYILADDMGYGDVHSVCTPTRYGLMTGRYNWRSTRLKGVLNGLSPSLIPTSRTTVANVLKDAGYKTAMVGKWHLGLGL